MSFSGANVLITGGSRGIGRATAELFARDGATVYVNFRTNVTAAEDALAAIRAAGSKGHLVQGDVEDPAAIRSIFETISARSGRLDILVANAAATAFKPLLETRAHNIDRTFGLSVRGFLLLSQGAVSLMTGRGGAIVAVSNLASQLCFPRHGALGAAKAAVESMVRYLAVECGPLGIRVNAVNPGFMDTESSRMYMGSRWEAIKERVERCTPLGRVSTPQDVARAIRLLCSDDASMITGQTLIIDGGVSLGAGIPEILEGVAPSGRPK